MKKSELSPNGNSVENLIRQSVKKYGMPIMLIRRTILEKQFQRFKKNLPQVLPYYAIKANPNPEIIKTFARLGSNFDVASAREMDLVLSLKVSPRRIIFANTIKSNEDIAAAHKANVNLMTFDNEAELYKIAKYAPGSRVLIRIKVGNAGSIVELSLKFGAEPKHAAFLLRKARALGLQPLGVAFHVGSQCTNIANYTQALEIAAQIFREAKTEGMALRMLDIGGGFPIRHFDREKQIVFEDIARKIQNELSRLFDPRVKVIAEPGRFFAGPAGILVTKVVGRAFRDNKNYYYINDGVYGDFSGIAFDHCKYELKTLRRGHKYLSTVAGPTCDSFDIISLTEELPELDLGNVIYAKNIGAYSSASAVQGFNGFMPAKAILVD